jgi:protein-arginine kinase activator protein McsA
VEKLRSRQLAAKTQAADISAQGSEFSESSVRAKAGAARVFGITERTAGIVDNSARLAAQNKALIEQNEKLNQLQSDLYSALKAHNDRKAAELASQIKELQARGPQ